MMRDTQPWINYEDLVARCDVMLRDVGIATLGAGTLRLWLAEACREFARRSGSVRDQHLAVMVAGFQEYRLPVDALRPDLVSIQWPGIDDELELIPYTLQQAVLEGLIQETGTPSMWYVGHDRRSIGIVPTPSDGGVDSVTTALAGDTTSVVDSTLGTTDDVYVGLTLRILSGDQEGQERTITAYDAATTTLTVDTAFTAAIAATVRYQIHPDSLRIRYTKSGNSYRIQPTNATLSAATSRTVFTLDLPDRPIDWWNGCEVRFTSGALKDEVTRILSATSTTVPATTVTVEPELFETPAGTETVVVTDVPNIPSAFHHALVDYVVFMALDRAGNPQALTHLQRFAEMAGESMEQDQPVQGQTFERVQESRWGDEGWD